MKLGNHRFGLLLIYLVLLNTSLFAENSVSTSPLINLNELKPSFEEEEDSSNNTSTNQIIKGKKKILPKNNLSSAKFIGLDKITAKTSEIVVNLGEVKKFGPLEIKVLKCGEKVLKHW